MMEEDIANVAGGNAIAGAGTTDPIVKSANTTTEVVERKQFAGCEVFVVDSTTYNSCRRAKLQHERFAAHVGEGAIGAAIREYAKTNPGKGIMIECGATGTITYLRLPRGRNGVQF